MVSLQDKPRQADLLLLSLVCLGHLLLLMSIAYRLPAPAEPVRQASINTRLISLPAPTVMAPASTHQVRPVQPPGRPAMRKQLVTARASPARARLAEARPAATSSPFAMQARPAATVSAPRPATRATEISAPRSNASGLNNPKPPYPLLSRNLGEEGTVILNVMVETDGTVSAVSIARSSGYDRLDQSALRTVQRWHYQPAQQQGQAIRMRNQQPVTFRLND